MDLINQTVGDALSDMLMVEAILHARGWDVQDWSMAYQVIVFSENFVKRLTLNSNDNPDANLAIHCFKFNRIFPIDRLKFELQIGT